jgi:carbamoyl-phosphate synthase small subunit
MTTGPEPRTRTERGASGPAGEAGSGAGGSAAGAETRRLRFGHHGANHPVQDLGSGHVQVTAQNHEVEVVGETLPADSGFTVSQRNLNDGSVEGLRHVSLPIETVQYHPEGSPGPLDALEVFDRFVTRVRERGSWGASR